MCYDSGNFRTTDRLPINFRVFQSTTSECRANNKTVQILEHCNVNNAALMGINIILKSLFLAFKSCLFSQLTFILVMCFESSERSCRLNISWEHELLNKSSLDIYSDYLVSLFKVSSFIFTQSQT